MEQCRTWETNNIISAGHESPDEPVIALHLTVSRSTFSHLHQTYVFKVISSSQFHMSSICSANHSLLYLVSLILFGEMNKKWRSSLCNVLRPLPAWYVLRLMMEKTVAKSGRGALASKAICACLSYKWCKNALKLRVLCWKLIQPVYSLAVWISLKNYGNYKKNTKVFTTGADLWKPASGFRRETEKLPQSNTFLKTRNNNLRQTV
jgi:hypothetical protein